MAYIKEQRMSECITYDDNDSVDRNLSLQHYDALILFAEEDEEFASELINKVEGFGLKVNSHLRHSAQQKNVTLKFLFSYVLRIEISWED